MAGALQEDKITVDVASTSTTTTGSTDLSEARPGTPEVPVEETPRTCLIRRTAEGDRPGSRRQESLLYGICWFVPSFLSNIFS